MRVQHKSQVLRFSGPWSGRETLKLVEVDKWEFELYVADVKSNCVVAEEPEAQSL